MRKLLILISLLFYCSYSPCIAQKYGYYTMLTQNSGLSGLYFEPSFSFNINRHEVNAGPNFLILSDFSINPFLDQEARSFSDRFGMHLQYVFYPGKRAKALEMGLMYKFEYNRIFISYGSIGDWEVNTFLNNIGYKLNYHISNSIDLTHDLGLGVFTFPLWKDNVQNIQFSLGAKFKLRNKE